MLRPSWVIAVQNALSFDVEEYFQAEVFAGLVQAEDWSRLPSRVVEGTLPILDRLEERGVSATFFVVGWVAERYPGLVREIRARGHEVACHGFAHRPIYAMDRSAFRSDVRRANQALEDAVGGPILGYRAPTFSVVRESLWALEVLAEEGFRYDSSIFPIHHDRYGISDAPRFPHRVVLPSGGVITEFPMTTVRLAGQRVPFSGGGYFRLAPYAVIRAGISRVNAREGMPAMVYLHSWEMDPAQPRLPLKGVARFRHYVNLRQTAGKLDRLLGDFAFAPAREVLGAAGFLEAVA